MPLELKKPTTYEEQLAILQKRGCIISDEAFCKQVLASVNYYRLTAYFLPFKRFDGNYIRGTSFYRIYRIYEFDRKLRGILFTAIEEVEIYLRTKFSYFHEHIYGAVGYLDPSNFSEEHDHLKFKGNIDREILSNNKVLFVKHHIDNYNGVFPIWVISELFTFGMLSYFYSDMKTQDRKILSKELYETVPQHVTSWLRCCTDLRNICAHYGRLYYRIFSAVPGGIPLKEGEQRRLYGAIHSLRALYPDPQKWNREVLTAIESLFYEYKDDIDLYHLAFPKDWAEKMRK